jgi:hypothetical protein
MKKCDMSWAAGLFEGEGCISMRSSGASGLSIKMTDKDVLERFREVVGRGSIYEISWYEKNGHKPQWRWEATSYSDMEYIIGEFLPYLGSRRKEKAVHALDHKRKRMEKAHETSVQNGKKLAEWNAAHK